VQDNDRIIFNSYIFQNREFSTIQQAIVKSETKALTFDTGNKNLEVVIKVNGKTAMTRTAKQTTE